MRLCTIAALTAWSVPALALGSAPESISGLSMGQQIATAPYDVKLSPLLGDSGKILQSCRRERFTITDSKFTVLTGELYQGKIVRVVVEQVVELSEKEVCLLAKRFVDKYGSPGRITVAGEQGADSSPRVLSSIGLCRGSPSVEMEYAWHFAGIIGDTITGIGDGIRLGIEVNKKLYKLDLYGEGAETRFDKIDWRCKELRRKERVDKIEIPD